MSSFGYGGVNAHAVIEEPVPALPPAPAKVEEGVLVLSARDPERLRAYAAALRDFLAARVGRADALQDGTKVRPAAAIQDGVLSICADMLGIGEHDLRADAFAVETLLRHPSVERLAERISSTWDVDVAADELAALDSATAVAQHVAARLRGPVGPAPGSVMGPSFRSVLHTLQVGRDAMEERLAVVASGPEEAIAGLDAYLRGDAIPGRLFRGKHRDAGTPSGARTGEQAAEVAEDLRHRRAAALAERWSSGAHVDWVRWYGPDLPGRVPLPTYPFARDRHWICGDDTPQADPASTPSAAPAPHPAMVRSDGALGEVCFTTVLTGEEWFLRDHAVHGRRILPAAVCLEMARAAAARADGAGRSCVLEDARWMRPVVSSGQPQELSITLRRDGPGFAFTVAARGETGSVEHARGRVLSGGGGAEDAGEPLDLERLLESCTERRSGAAWYESLRRRGLDYGPSLQVVQEAGWDGRRVVARLRLRAGAADREFLLHPALVDAAFQSIAPLLVPEWSTGQAMPVPVALDRLEMLGPLGDECFACAEPDDDRPRPPGGRSFRIVLVDPRGRSRLRMHGLMVKPMERLAREPEASRGREERTLVYCHPGWRPEALEPPRPAACDGPPLLVLGRDASCLDAVRAGLDALGVSPARTTAVSPGERFSRSGRDHFEVDVEREDSFDELLDRLEPDRHPGWIVHLWSDADLEDRVPERQLMLGVYSLTSLCQAISRRRSKQRIAVVYAFASGPEGRPIHAAVSALARTVRLESSAISIKTVELAGSGGALPSLTSPASLAVILRELAAAAGRDTEIQYRDGRRHVSRLDQLQVTV